MLPYIVAPWILWVMTVCRLIHPLRMTTRPSKQSCWDRPTIAGTVQLVNGLLGSNLPIHGTGTGKEYRSSDGRELLQNMTKTDPFSVVFQNICRGGQGLLKFDEISIALHRFGLRSSTHLTPKASTKFQAAQTGS